MKVGIKGISYSTTERKYLVRVIKDSKRVYLGRFSSLEEAKQALEAEGKETKNTDTPILESLRASFAPKKAKTSSYKTKSSKSQSSEPVKMTQKTATSLAKKTKAVSKSKVKHIVVDEPKDLNTNDVKFTTTSLLTMDVDSINHVAAENNLRIILKYLIREADRRGTSVFDVIVQEVAKLSK